MPPSMPIRVDRAGRSGSGLRGLGNDNFAISVRDEGVGLPPEFDPRKPKGLGMRIINSFGEQFNAKVEARARDPGTEFAAFYSLASLVRGGERSLVNTRAIQGYLGHRSIVSTQRYTAFAPDRFKRFWKD